MRNIFIFILIIAVLAGCQDKKSEPVADVSFAKELQKNLIMADSGSTIVIPEGFFQFDRSISLDGINHVTIKGAGKDKSILSFLGQKDGAEGMLIKANNILLEGFTIQDSEGDALKIQSSDHVTIRNVNTTWTQGAKSSNGGYGLYPVDCSNVLIEHCEASYASDAGIYVGQSRRVIMRNNLAHHNVAGIEIENSQDVEAFDNVAENNTGGILIFDMPGLPQANGARVKVYNNISRDNNFENFAPEGGVVSTLPPGSGILVIAHRDVEIYNNKITGYKTLGLGVISWLFTQRPFDTINGYDPYYKNVYVHDNVLVRKQAIPDLSKEFGQMINALFIGKPQDIMIDGIFDPEDKINNPICFQNNGEELRFTNLNASTATGISDLKKLLDDNMSKFQCSFDPFEVLSPIAD
ncbi:MAG: right-handed parallel beta-helix repeat-containing protein [Saprospiraceae bacterium]|nr:right-handed parallel beta-helix repeat-containing protein [Saprospiraceae bacterium]